MIFEQEGREDREGFDPSIFRISPSFPTFLFKLYFGENETARTSK